MKKRNFWKTFTSCSVAVAAAVALASCGGSGTNYAANNTVFKIGLTGPLTGGAAAYGKAVENSAKMAVAEINAAGGYKGIKFEVTALDDALDATTAGNNFNTLYEAGMQISLGAVTSGCCIEFGSRCQEENVFALTPSATSDQVYAIGENMYQMCFSDSGQGTASANYISDNFPNAKVGVFYDSSDAYSSGIFNTFKAAYKGTYKTATFTSATKTDFSGQVNSLKDCDLIFMPIYYSEAALFISTAKGIISNSAVYFGCDGLDGIETVSGFNPDTYTQEISYLSHFNSAKAGKTATYVANYTAAYGKDTLNQFGASAYDCVYAILAAMNAYDGTISVTTSASDMAKILKGEFQKSTFTFAGVTGDAVKWNANGTVSKAADKYVVNPNREQ